MVQLYLHSGQLPTRSLLENRGLTSSSHCRFGCEAPESPLHLFTICPVFHHFRQSTLDNLHQTSSSLMEGINCQLRSSNFGYYSLYSLFFITIGMASWIKFLVFRSYSI